MPVVSLEIPIEYRCPISYELMIGEKHFPTRIYHGPHVQASHQAYSASSLRQWRTATAHPYDPITQAPLSKDCRFVPDQALKNEIEQFLQAKGYCLPQEFLAVIHAVDLERFKRLNYPDFYFYNLRDQSLLVFLLELNEFDMADEFIAQGYKPVIEEIQLFAKSAAVLQWCVKHNLLSLEDISNFLNKAVKNGNVVVASVLCTQKIDKILNSLDESGRSLLHRAAQFNNVQMVFILLMAGANPTLRDRLRHGPAFHTSNITIKYMLALFTQLHRNMLRRGQDGVEGKISHAIEHNDYFVKPPLETEVDPYIYKVLDALSDLNTAAKAMNKVLWQWTAWWPEGTGLVEAIHTENKALLSNILSSSVALVDKQQLLFQYATRIRQLKTEYVVLSKQSFLYYLLKQMTQQSVTSWSVWLVNVMCENNHSSMAAMSTFLEEKGMMTLMLGTFAAVIKSGLSLPQALDERVWQPLTQPLEELTVNASHCVSTLHWYQQQRAVRSTVDDSALASLHLKHTMRRY